jgi:CRP-like cAMP-binding protein
MATQLLQDIYLFKDLTSKELEELSARGTVRTYNQDEEVFVEGEVATSLYVIRYGTISIRRAGKDKSLDVAQLGTGAHFGEMSFVDGNQRSATAVALERTELLDISFEALNDYFTKNPATALRFYRSLTHFLASRLRVTTMDLSFSREKNIRHF